MTKRAMNWMTAPKRLFFIVVFFFKIFFNVKVWTFAFFWIGVQTSSLSNRFKWFLLASAVLFSKKIVGLQVFESEKPKDHLKVSENNIQDTGKSGKPKMVFPSRNVHDPRHRLYRHRLSTWLLTAVGAKASSSAFEQLANREALCPSFLLHKDIEIE